MNIRVHALIPVTEVNGPGKRFGIWVQGCTKACPDCYNPEAQDPLGGYEMTIEELFDQILSTDGIEGVSISGGEPLEQASAISELISRIKNNSDLSVLIFTALSLEQIKEHNDINRLSDYLVLNHRHNQEFHLDSEISTVIASDQFPQDIEIHIHEDGDIEVTGFPTDDEKEALISDLSGESLLNESANIAYLFGSGLSIPLGLDNVKDLTQKILNADQNAILHTDQSYQIGLTPRLHQPGEITTEIAVEFLHKIVGFIKRNDTINRIEQPTYEDVADFIKQFHLSISGEYENTALGRSFLKEMRYYAFRRGVLVKHLLEYSIILIDCMLKHYLSHDHSIVLENLGLIDNVIPEFLFQSQLDVFTLNHDLVIEDFINTKGIAYGDGFYPNSEGLEYFDFGRFIRSSYRVKLVKLHGSIDRYYHNQSMIKTPDPRYINDPVNNGFSDNFVPSVLSGKIVKMLDYSKPIHADLYSYFRVKLATEISKLIVVGYGFGDKGINNAISSWFKQNASNRLIVVTFNEDALISGSRYAIASILANPEYKQNRRVIVLQGGIQNLTKNSIISALR